MSAHEQIRAMLDELMGTGRDGERKRLVKNAIPSIFSFSHKKSASATRRMERRKQKLRDVCKSVDPDIVPEVGSEQTVGEDVVEVEEDVMEPKTDIHMGVQCQILTDANCRFSVHNFAEDPRAIHYYTGLSDFAHFMLVFNILGPAKYHLNFKCSLLSLENQFFLVLMKLRQAKDDRELSILFRISESSVSVLVNCWINFMYFQFNEIDIWPSKSVVLEHMPYSFGKQFQSTRVVLDATEVPIRKPGNVVSQSATFSTYKNKNTLKTMIGVSPRGLVSYISDSYGGSASDRQIIERSVLVNGNMFDPKDSIMADRGIMVQDLFANKDVYVNTPTMLKGKSQLEPEEVVHDRRVASKRIHVERVIGLGKTYKILTKELPASKRNMGSRIIYICFILSNFRESIVNQLA